MSFSSKIIITPYLLPLLFTGALGAAAEPIATVERIMFEEVHPVVVVHDGLFMLGESVLPVGSFAAIAFQNSTIIASSEADTDLFCSRVMLTNSKISSSEGKPIMLDWSSIKEANLSKVRIGKGVRLFLREQDELQLKGVIIEEDAELVLCMKADSPAYKNVAKRDRASVFTDSTAFEKYKAAAKKPRPHNESNEIESSTDTEG